MGHQALELLICAKELYGTGKTMTDNDRVFVGSVPEFYDTYLVPLIFEGYAKDLAVRTAALMPKAILETAAGTGAVTRELAARLEPDAHLVVTDLNQPMLDRAVSMQSPDNRIEWRQADALNLPFDDNSFDAVVCQFGVMFFPDKVAGYAEARRTLRLGGKFLFNVWDRIEANEFAYIVTEAAATVFPADPPRFLARTPHGYHDIEVIRQELKKAGFSAVSISTVEKTSTALSPRHAAIAFCQGSPLRNEIEARDAKLVNVVTDMAALALSERYGTGAVSGKIRAHVVTGSR
jgi:ubiquinone/menaquinone biosynthesis C-methylase UbiE